MNEFIQMCQGDQGIFLKKSIPSILDIFFFKFPELKHLKISIKKI